MKTRIRASWFSLLSGLALMAVVLLAGCGGGGSDNGPAPISPNGYYEGSATVKEDDDTTDLPIADLQGMLNGNRLMLVSASEQLLYDGTITITGNSFAGELNVYQSGLPVTKDYGSGPEPMKIPVSGNVTGGSSVTGILAAERAGKGTFTLTYALSNSQKADLARIDTNFDVDTYKGEFWGSQVG